MVIVRATFATDRSILPMKIIKRLLWSVLVLVLLGAGFIAHTWYFKPVTLDLFYGRVFLKFALDSPELLSSLRILESVGLRFHNDDLGDESPAHDQRQAARLKDDLETLRSYDRAQLVGEAQLSYDVMEYFLAMIVKGDRFRLHNFPVNQLFGVQSSFPKFMIDTHQVNDVRDATDYIARLSKVGWKFDGVLEGLKLREQEKIIPPRFVIEKVLTEMRNFIGVPAEENTLYVEFAKKLDKLGDAIEAPRRKQLLTEARSTIETRVYPAYQSLITYFEQLAPKARGNDGAWSLPDGDAFYALQVEQQTTTTLTPEEVHALGQTEVARIETEMDTILKGAGLSEGTIGARVRQLSAQPEQQYPDTDEGRAQILADYQKIIDEIDAGLAPAFDVRPRSKVQVKRVPEFAEKTAPGAYYDPPALDGSRPGTFYANLRNVGEITRFGMRTLAYHEGIPGHHFQIGLARELKGLPFFRTLVPFTAYSEGWALYTEQLAWEMGFQSNPLDNLGRLQAEMFRAVRLVVDTGVHYKRWSREQAIAFMIDKTGMGDDEVTAEIERYLVNPGQALAYKVGMLKILELRQKARDALGARFDLKRFHAEVLTHGALPLHLLERVIDDWIARSKGAPGAA